MFRPFVYDICTRRVEDGSGRPNKSSECGLSTALGKAGCLTELC